MDEGVFQVDELIAKLRQTNGPWTAGVTSLSELSREEKRLRLGATPPPEEASLDEREATVAARHPGVTTGAAPAAHNWHDVGGKDFITPVQNQRNCGSCVAFGCVAAVEGTLRVKRNDPNFAVDLSEAHLFYCHAAAQGRNCSNGWWVDPALNAFRDIGVVDEGCYPYTAGDQACRVCGDWQKRVLKIPSWQLLSTPADMKNWLSTKGPVAACFKVYEDFYSYQSGIYKHTSGDFLGGHCICVVGYQDPESCWICKNSWGKTWGEGGFFRIKYGDSGIDYTMWGVDAPMTETETWLNKKLITGLWSVNQERSAAAYVDGVGWRRMSNESDSIFSAMVTMLSAAKVAKSPVNLRVEGEVIREVYIF